MSSTLIAMATLIPLFLIIIFTIFFIRLKSKKKSQKQQNHFISVCRDNGFQIEHFMKRRNRLAALNTEHNRIAIADFNTEPIQEPLIFSFQAEGKQSLKIIKNNNKWIQKIALKPATKTPSKDIPEIVFYDWQYDDETLLNAYMEEAKTWKKTLNSI